MRKLIADMHAERHDILEGEPPHTPMGEPVAATLADEHLGYGHQAIETSQGGETFETLLTEATGFGGEKGDGSAEPTSGKEGRGRGVKHAA